MGGTPTGQIFTPNYICIGEDHNGQYAFNFNNKKDCYRLLQFVISKDGVIKLWYEGSREDNTGKSFPKFKNDLTAYLNKCNLQYNIITDGWDKDNIFDREDVIAGVLLGGEPNNYKDILGAQLNNRQSLLDAFSKIQWTLREFNNVTTTFKKEEIKEALSSNGKPSDILLEMQEENSANMTTLKKLYGGAYKAMRAKYFEGTPGALTSSKVFERVKRFNDKRDDNLASVIKKNGGIFLMGDGHVDAVKKRLPSTNNTFY